MKKTLIISLFFAAFMCGIAIDSNAQTHSFVVTGTAYAYENGTLEPLPGVSVVVKGTAMGTITDANGHYSIIVPDENAVLVFSFIGWTAIEIVVGTKRVIDVTFYFNKKQ